MTLRWGSVGGVGVDVDKGWCWGGRWRGVYCADDFSPVQTSSRAALYLKQCTVCYCSCSAMTCGSCSLIVIIRRKRVIMIRITRSECDFQFACELGAMSEMKFVLTRTKNCRLRKV